MSPPKRAFLCIAAAAVLLAPLPARGAASEWSANPEVKVRLISPLAVAPRRGELLLGLHFRLIPGWHIYWKNSGDAGFPPAVALRPEEWLGKPEILWPAPSRFHLPGDLVAFGYEDEVVYPLRVEMKGREAPGGGSLPIEADVDYVVCEAECIPYRAKLLLEQPLGDAPVADPETAPLLRSWLDRLPRTLAETPGVTLDTMVDAGSPGRPELEVRLRGVTAEEGKSEIFLEVHEDLEAGRPRLKSFGDGVIFRVPLKPKEAGKPLPGKVLLGWTVSNLGRQGKTFALEDRREVAVWNEPALAPRKAPAAAPEKLARLLLWAFLGGALLNLAPTVLALLGGELLALREDLPAVRERSAAAAAGILGGCWAVAGLMLAARGTGRPAGWGAQLQEPALAALLAVAAALLALNLWGLVEVPLAPAGSSRPGTVRHLVAGLFTVPLALAWPLPLLEEPFGYAFARGPATVCAVYAVLGFGLALPYLALAAAPALIRRAPAAPAWRPRLREGLGFLAGASIFWILHLLSRQVSPEGLAWIELCLLGMALLAWLRAGEGRGKATRFALALGLAACAAGALWLAEHNRLAPRTAGSAPERALLTVSSHGLPPAAREPAPNQTSGGSTCAT